MICWEIVQTVLGQMKSTEGTRVSRPFPLIWSLGVVDALLVGDHIDFSMMYDLRVGIHWVGMILNSGCDPLRNYILWT
jgi:hypothetical protein